MEYRNLKTLNLNSIRGEEAHELRPMSVRKALRSKPASAKAAG